MATMAASNPPSSAKRSARTRVQPAGGHEDVAHRVVLAVVDLPGLHPLDHRAGLVGVHPDVQQDRRVVPADHLGRDDAGVGAERLLDHDVDGVRVRRTVVVAEEEEGRPLDHRPGPGRPPPRTPGRRRAAARRPRAGSAATRAVGSSSPPTPAPGRTALRSPGRPGGQRLLEPRPGSRVTTTATTAGARTSIGASSIRSRGYRFPLRHSWVAAGAGTPPGCLQLFIKRYTIRCHQRSSRRRADGDQHHGRPSCRN